MVEYINNVIILLTFVIFIIYIITITTNLKNINGIPLWDEKLYILDYEGTSLQLIDVYSLTHITHGIILYFILFEFMKIKQKNAFIIALIIEIIWEIFENLDHLVINYRKRYDDSYGGDSIVNIIGDILFVILGFYLSIKSKPLAILYIIISELILSQYDNHLIYICYQYFNIIMGLL